MNREGGCACGAIRYKLTAAPLIVHACHCRDCQRLTGSAFATNLWMEQPAVESSGAEPRSFRLVGGSGEPHDVFFCANCGTYVWGRYHAAPAGHLFVPAGTLDDPQSVKADVHIFTRSKLPWVILPDDVRSFATFYDLNKVWPDESLARIGRKRGAQS